MFIVEGLDYAGKSTTLETLQKGIRKQRWERWHPNKDISDIQRWGKLPPEFDYCESYINACTGAQLCDRFVLSELAYGEVFRGGPNKAFDSHARRRVARMLNITGSVTLLVKCDWDSTLERAKERCTSEFDAAMKVRQTYEQGTAAFQHALQDLALGRRGGTFLGEYDTSKVWYKEPKEIENARVAHMDRIDWYLVQWKMHLERATLVHRMCPRGWGYLWPKILFVGENINHPTSQWPFSGDNAASRSLSDLLDGADIGEKELFLWNAYEFRGHQLLTKEGVATLAPKLIVALGKEAHDQLDALKIKHVEFPHPQWIGRFHRKEMDQWAQKLKALCRPALGS